MLTPVDAKQGGVRQVRRMRGAAAALRLELVAEVPDVAAPEVKRQRGRGLGADAAPLRRELLLQKVPQRHLCDGDLRVSERT